MVPKFSFQFVWLNVLRISIDLHAQEIQMKNNNET